jgi:hypothetical protein
MCGQAIDPASFATYRYVSGWARLRAKGTNQVAHARHHDRWACGPCIAAGRDHTDQQTLQL